MPFSPGGIRIDPANQTAVVSFTILNGGGTPIAYSSIGGTGTLALPATITTPTTFYFAEQTQFVVSALVGGVQAASPSGGTVAVDLSSEGTAALTLSVPGSVALTKSAADATYSAIGLRRVRNVLTAGHPAGGLVAASPPTVVQSAGGASSAITSAVSVDPLDARLAYLGSGGVAKGKDYPYSLFTYTSNVYPNVNLATQSGNPVSAGAGTYYRIAFGFDGLTFEFKFQGTYATGNFRVRVNGQRATSLPTVTAVSDGQQYLVKVTFATAVPRLIEVEMVSAPFGGLNIGPTDNLWAAPKFDGPRALWLGDSYVAGSGTLNQLCSFATTASDLLGWEPFLSGIGGTGLINAGSAVTARSRVGTDITPWNPAIVVDGMGHNDVASSQAAIQAEATLLYQAIAAALPNTMILSLGPLPSQIADASNSGYLNVRNGKQAAAAALGIPFIDTLTVPIFPGANAAGYVQGDNVHPTPSGGEYLGWQVEARIIAALATAA